MKDKTIIAAVILGVCLIISSYLLSSGMKSLSGGISRAGASIGSGITHTAAANSMKVDLSLSSGNSPIRFQELK